MNDNDKPKDRPDRVIARALVDTAVTHQTLGPGLQNLLEAYGVSPAARNAVAHYLTPHLERMAESEKAVIHHAREAQSAHALSAGLAEVMDHTMNRIEMLAEEVERAAVTPRETQAAHTLRKWVREAVTSWFGDRRQPAKDRDGPER